MRVLVVEDDSLLAQGLVRVLTRAGHAVDRVETGVQADRALRAASYDLVVLDIGLPDIDGFEVLRRLRLRHAGANVLVLTARDAVEDRVHGLDLGADDYLTKPFSVTEFEARVRALLRRTSLPAGAVSIGRLTIDVEAKLIRISGTPIELTGREWALLGLVMAANVRMEPEGPRLAMLKQAQEALLYDHEDTLIFQIRAPGGAVIAGDEDLNLPPNLVPGERSFFDSRYHGEPVRVAAVRSNSGLYVQVAETLHKRNRLIWEILAAGLLPALL